ncbi:hypothetical protein Vafri_12833 [Volvox africanus]|uniref:Uncharacterized protein n=1 Tax=Volvox africanus TaxID=51714 RepID=A0A8J4BAY7_9CHLO|nr:hypothetical protein Vafri_12833 [Volvox africanus]
MGAAVTVELRAATMATGAGGVDDDWQNEVMVGAGGCTGGDGTDVMTVPNADSDSGVITDAADGCRYVWCSFVSGGGRDGSGGRTGGRGIWPSATFRGAAPGGGGHRAKCITVSGRYRKAWLRLRLSSWYLRRQRE